MHGDADLAQAQRALAEHVARRVDQASPKAPWATIRIPIIASLPLTFLLQRIDEHAGDVEAGLVLDLAEAGRAGDVDFGEVVADHVQPDQQQAARGEHRPERLGDLAVARR